MNRRHNKIAARLRFLGQLGAGLIAFLIVMELVLRLAFGLGSPVLSMADAETGYRFQPNQNLVRFGNRIQYNQYSQRSAPITVPKPEDVLRILMTGDSILNGGTPIDQAQIITELLKDHLTHTGHTAEVLNASAGSWGIGNELAYLRKFGLFGSDAVILEIGTNDLAQPTSTSRLVGIDPNLPDHDPPLALEELCTRYLFPRLYGELFKYNLVPQGANPLASSGVQVPLATDPAQQAAANRQSLTQIIELLRAKKLPVAVLFVPEKVNLVPQPNPPLYQAELLALLDTLKVPTLDLLPLWAKLSAEALGKLYREDNLHLSAEGNRAIADALFQHFCLEKVLTVCAPR